MVFIFSLTIAYLFSLVISVCGNFVPMWWPLPDPYLLLTCFFALREENLFQSMIMILILGLSLDLITHEILGYNSLLYGLLFLSIVMVISKNHGSSKRENWIVYFNISLISFIFHIISKVIIFWLMPSHQNISISYVILPTIFAVENFLLAVIFWPILEYNRKIFSFSN